MFNEIFVGAEPTVGIDGLPTAKLTADLQRFNRVMRMIAYGLYFHLNCKTYVGGFDVYSPNFTGTGPETQKDRDYMNVVSRVAAKTNFKRVELPNEDVFALGINIQNDFEFVYRLEFYNGFTVIAVSVPPWRKQRSQ
jgi:hypothetical protein